ncbi:TetR/AcrR family transcriptional regulator [Streptomyces sp. H27-D2]|uniref:TetR/AcrR family transcriptional regulator n=1 Tax=Streptomyces sp. H27-D2 TaxID=3046304 RepID=UPI002DBB4A97|nr:TetR/AcrR family transcriptional regulator [Streptomyces sp. H27-D2]MEC4015495.1 TetR/AcrR family transcriptional regulator [Streptomyces sp. H27-D2]
MTPPIEGPRARFREQTRGEIKEIALRQLADGGTGAIALTRIAKDLGMSGPALYRYFAGRDDLISALIRDAYDDLATAVGHAAEACPAGRSPRERLRALAGAYRSWAVESPHRYLLIAGTPLPGYTAPADTLLRARAALGPFLKVFAGGDPNPATLPMVRQMDAWAQREAEVAAWVARELGTADGDDAGRALAGAVLAWSQMHGAVSLEVASQFSGMGHDPLTLLEAGLDALADAFQLS